MQQQVSPSISLLPLARTKPEGPSAQEVSPAVSDIDFNGSSAPSELQKGRLWPLDMPQSLYQGSQALQINSNGTVPPPYPSPATAPLNTFETLLRDQSRLEITTEQGTGSYPQQDGSYDISQVMQELKLFLATAPTSLSGGSGGQVCKFPMPDGDTISCVLWNNIYHITGTDIVKCMLFRFKALGRTVIHHKKFEEGIFSDLRNLKPGFDSTLEEPKSEFLEFLFESKCIRTQKKQKVFYWFSVPHTRLFMDAVARDIKREQQGQEPTSVSDFPRSHTKTLQDAEIQCAPLIHPETMGGHASPEQLLASDFEIGVVPMNAVLSDPSVSASSITSSSNGPSPAAPRYKQTKRGAGSGGAYHSAKALLSKAIGNATAANAAQLAPHLKELYRSKSMSSEINSESSSPGSSMRSSLSSLGGGVSTDESAGEGGGATSKSFSCAHPGCPKKFKIFENLRRHQRVHADALGDTPLSPQKYQHSQLPQLLPKPQPQPQSHPQPQTQAHQKPQHYFLPEFQQETQHLSKLFDQELQVVSGGVASYDHYRPLYSPSSESPGEYQPMFTTTSYQPMFSMTGSSNSGITSPPWSASYTHQIYQQHVGFVADNVSPLSIETSSALSEPPMFDVNNNLIETPISANPGLVLGKTGGGGGDAGDASLFNSVMMLSSPSNAGLIHAKDGTSSPSQFMGEYRPLFTGASTAPNQEQQQQRPQQLQQKQQQYKLGVFDSNDESQLDVFQPPNVSAPRKGSFGIGQMEDYDDAPLSGSNFFSMPGP